MLRQIVSIVFIFHLSFEYAELNTNATFDNLHYITDSVSWTDAGKQCKDRHAGLVDILNPDRHNHNISVVKRSVNMRPGNESWIGDYTTYAVSSGQGSVLDVHPHLCAALHIEVERELNQSTYLYEYSVLATNCTHLYKGLCAGTNMVVRPSGMPKSWNETRTDNCQLWTPGYTSYNVAKGENFGKGNFTASRSGTSKSSLNLVSQTYWVNYLIEESPSNLPVYGNIFRCGYISYYHPGIYYTDCNQEKPFICREEEQHQKALDKGSQPVGLYAGIPVGIIVVVATVISIIVFIKRRNLQCGEKIPEELPRGGRSFTRRDKGPDTGDTDTKTDNRLTTYNQINIDHEITIVPEGREEIRANDLHHEYSTVDRARKKGAKPDIIPRASRTKTPSIGGPGYLTMDGRGSNQYVGDGGKHYDFLNSTRSTGSERNNQMDESDNVYNLPSDIDDSTYDVTFQRHSSQKRLINEEYDHVVIENGSATMNRRTCDSINAETNAAAVKMSPRSNPCYEKVIR